MQNRNIFGITESIVSYLSEQCNICTLRWKSSSSTEPADYAEVRPKVYAYTFDGDGEIPDSPSVLIQTTRITPDSIHYVVYLSVVHSAILEAEKVDPVEGTQDQFKYRTETVEEEGQEVPATGYTSDGVRRELYKITLMLSDFVFTALMRMGNQCAEIRNLNLTPPSAFMQEFPYCSATIEFDAQYHTRPVSVVGTSLQDLL